MNQKTAKVLRKFATAKNLDYEKTKQRWESLTWRERTKERKIMLQAIQEA